MLTIGQPLSFIKCGKFIDYLIQTFQWNLESLNFGICILIITKEDSLE